MGHLHRLMEWLRRIVAIRRAYKWSHGRRPALFFPRRYSEKIQWRKLFDSESRHAIFCDKLTTRAYIAEKGFGHLLPELVWSGEDLADSPLRSLSFPFVVKSNHASAQYILVRDLSSLDYVQMIEQAKSWLTVDWGEKLHEPAYLGIPRRLMIERLVGKTDGTWAIEHRVYVFHGNARLIGTLLVTSDGVFSLFHNPGWERLDWIGPNPPYAGALPRPKQLEAMLAIAENLAEEYDHLRVDFYDDDQQLYVGEITVYTWSGLLNLKPPVADREIGAFWTLEKPFSKAIARIAFTRWGDPFRPR